MNQQNNKPNKLMCILLNKIKDKLNRALRLNIALLICIALMSFITEKGLGITVYDRSVNNTRVGGYMDTEWVSEGDINTFKAHRFIVQYGARLNQKIRFNSEIEYEYGGFVTNDDEDSNSQQGEIKIEQAWVDHDISDAFTIRTGIILVPVGQLNIYHDSDMRDFTARPLVNKYIIPTTWMDTGIGGYGSTEFGDLEFNYEGYVMNGLNHMNPGNFSSNGTRSMRPNFKNDSNKGKAVAARLGIIPSINTGVGISTYQAQSKQSMVALDWKYNIGKFGLKGEYATYSDGYNNEANGFNFEGKINIAPMIGISNELNALARYEAVDLVAGNSNQGKLTRSSIGLNYRPMPSFVYKVEYSINDSQTKDKDNTLMASVAVGF